MDTHSELTPSDVFSEAMLAAINALKLIKDDLGGHLKPANDGHLKIGQREVIPGR
jgi:hypothetical protein